MTSILTFQLKITGIIAAGGGGGRSSTTTHSVKPSKKKQKINILTRLLSISSVPYTSYVPEPATFLHSVSAEAKQIWIMGVLVLMARVSTPMRLTLVGTVALISIAALPYRLWKPQLIRLAGLCAFIFCFAALGSDSVAPVMSDRAPTAVVTNLESTTSISQSSLLPSTLLPSSMVDVIGQTYNYVVVNLGPFSITKRSLSLAITLSGLMFVALQCASLCLITTPPERMAFAVGRALYPLGILGVPVKELVLTVLLALRFMATVFEEARNLCLGLASRGINWALLGGKGTLALTVSTASRLFSNLLARSDNIATAMTARGFRGPEEHELYLASGERKLGWRIVADGAALMSLIGLAGLSRYVV
jgi:energy-coupling factor transporter transmembrane protein EcfT